VIDEGEAVIVKRLDAEAIFRSACLWPILHLRNPYPAATLRVGSPAR